MKLVTFQHNGNPPQPGVVTGDVVAALPYDDMIAALEAGAFEPVGEGLPLSAGQLLAPPPRPASIRDCMAFEEHVINSTRAIGLGPYGRVDRLPPRPPPRPPSAAPPPTPP